MIDALRVFPVGWLAMGNIVKGSVILFYLLYQRHLTYRIAKLFHRIKSNFATISHISTARVGNATEW